MFEKNFLFCQKLKKDRRVSCKEKTKSEKK